MVKGLRQRTLEKLAHRYWTKHPKRPSSENWALAKKFLVKLEKRYKIKREE